MAVTVRRLHDTGKSAWWLLIMFIPFIGAIWLLVLLINDSDPDTNRYGDNPKHYNGYGRRAKEKSAALALIIASACNIFAIILCNIIDSIKYDGFHFYFLTGIDLLSGIALLFSAILLLPQKRQDISKMKVASIALMIASVIFLVPMIGSGINTLSHSFTLLHLIIHLVLVFVPAAMLFFAYTLHFKTELKKTASLILLIVAGCYLFLRIYWTVNWFHNPDLDGEIFITALYVLLPVSLMVLAYAFLSYNKDEYEEEGDSGENDYGAGPKTATTDEMDDDMLLQAIPITRKRMDLLWLDPPKLAQVQELVRQHNVITVTMGDSSNLRDHEITQEDVVWAKQVEKIVDKAFAFTQSRNHQKAIQHYKEALGLAPGCDLFLMSIGSCYAHLGQKNKAFRYLKRAHEISPGNSRIRNNMNEVQRM
jgi:uncharacterized membrane protein YhaH (DUF805 family)